MKRIELTKNQYTTVSDIDFNILNSRNWFALQCKGKFYAAYSENYRINGRKTCRSILMHRIIKNAPDGMVVDHIDGDRLNNQRSNLRICTAVENSQNRRKIKKGISKYKGVVWNDKKNRWQVGFRYNNIRMTRGYFEDEKDAAILYNKLANKYHGKFASLNII